MKIIKYLIGLLVVIFLIAGINISDTNNNLYVLNWGDYIDQELITAFEKEYGVKVLMSEVESNEAMYEQIKTNRTSFDIAIPSDYMIEQLEDEHLLQNIDYSKLENYNKDMFNNLSVQYGPKTSNYIPYFNGTIGIMYSTKNIPNIQEVIEKEGWNVFFDSGLLENAKVAMYNSSRDAFAVSMFYNNLDIDSTNINDLQKAANSLSHMKYSEFGDDNLKSQVVSGNIDVALVYSGDYYLELTTATDEEREIDFKYYVPKTTNYWVDGMVIPKQSKNTDLAYKFIDFMLNEDNALQNTQYIGYASPQIKVMDNLKEDEEYDYIMSDPYFDPMTIEGLNPQPYHFLGFDYMSTLEEMFSKIKGQ